MAEGLKKILNSEEDPKTLYTLKRLVGKGAFGKIYVGAKKGEEKDKTKQLAIKTLHYEPGNDENTKKLLDEIEYLKLTSPSPQMIQYHGSYLEKKKKGNFHLWVLMDYCDCGSLTSYIKSKDKPFAEAHIASICKQILHALSFLAKHGIAHRDLKAANILWNSAGAVKLSDFGEAIKIKEQKWDEESSNIAGTPYFMAPEITTGDPYTEKVDVWSLGVTLIELAEIKNPFFANPPFLVISQVATGMVVPSLKSPDNFSTDFNDFLKQCLVYEQEKRPSADQLLSHSFLSKGDDAGLSSVAAEYGKANEPSEEEEVQKDLAERNDSHKKVTTHLVVIRDKETGETLDEFLQNLNTWKEKNVGILSELSSQDKLGKLSFEKKGSSTSLKKQSPQQLDKRIQKLSTLVHLASRLSSQAFGLIVASRNLENVFHEKCFLGGECVDWIYENLKLQKRDEAIQLASHLVEAGLIKCLTEKKNIDSEASAFRFDYSKIVEWSRGYSFTQNSTSSLKRELSETNIPSSTRNLLSDEEVAKLNSSASQELTERDWSLIFSGANPSSYDKDQLIVKQDSDNRSLYRIKRGSVRVEKDEKGKMIPFGTMGVGQMFGEMSVLTGSKTSANILANESTEIYSADLNFMSRLFQSECGIQKRFYRNAALKLAKKLKEVGTAKSNDKKTIENSPSTAILDSRDKLYVELFGLPTDEVVIQEYGCFVKGLVKEPATLYVSQRYICVYGKVFGKPTKTVLTVRELIAVEVNKKKALKLKTKKKKVVLHGFKDVEATQTLVQSLRDASQANRTSQSSSLNLRVGKVEEEEGEILSDFDWLILLREAQCKSYKKNEVIVTEGEFAARIFQIGSGKCRVQVQGKTVGQMETGEVFGEISFLEGGKTSASVIADDDSVDVFIIEGAKLRVLFVRQPALAGRFYEYLSAILSTRLKEREKQTANAK